MIRLMIIDYNMKEKTLKQLDLSDLTDEGRQQMRYEASQWIVEIDEFEDMPQAFFTFQRNQTEAPCSD